MPPLTVKNTFLEFGDTEPASPNASRVRSYTDSAVSTQPAMGVSPMMEPVRGPKVLEEMGLHKLEEEGQDGLSNASTEEASNDLADTRPRLNTGGSACDSADHRRRLDTGVSVGDRSRLDTCASLGDRTRLDTGDLDRLRLDMLEWGEVDPVKVDTQMIAPPPQGQMMPPHMMAPYAPWLWGAGGQGYDPSAMWPMGMPMMPGPYDGYPPVWPGAYGMRGMPGPQGVKAWNSPQAAKPKAKARARTKSEEAGVKEKQDVPRTTAMLRNLPPEYTSQMLLDLLNTEGFSGLYTFVYLPIDFRTGQSFGYGFIDFVDATAVEKFRQHFDGFTTWAVPSTRICEVCWSEPLQGLDVHIERYRNSPMMHESVSDMFKPMMFKDGVRVPFPPPTKKLKPPRMRHARGEGQAAATE